MMARDKGAKRVSLDWPRVRRWLEMPDASPSNFAPVASYLDDSDAASCEFDERAVYVSILGAEDKPDKSDKRGRRRGSSTLAADAAEVFAHYCATMKRPRLRFTPDRQRRIKSILRQGYSVDECRLACEGILLSPHHTGDNEHGAEYLEISNVFKSGEHVERFARLASGDTLSPSGVASGKEQQQTNQIERLVEQRDARQMGTPNRRRRVRNDRGNN